MELNVTGKKSHRKATNHPMFHSESSKSSTAKNDHSEMSMSTILIKLAGLKSEIAMAESAKKYLKAHHLSKERDALKKVMRSMRGNESKINERSMKLESENGRKQAKVKDSSTTKMEHLNINTFSLKAANKKVENKSTVRPCTITSQSQNGTPTAMATEIGSLVNNTVSKKLVKDPNIAFKTVSKKLVRGPNIALKTVSKKLVNGPNNALKSNKADRMTPRGKNDLDIGKSSLKIEDSYMQESGVIFNKESKAFSPRLDKKSNENDSTGSTSNCTANEEKLRRLKLKLSQPNVQNEIFGGFAPATQAIHNSSQEWKFSPYLQNDSEPLPTSLYNELDEARYTKLDLLGSSPLGNAKIYNNSALDKIIPQAKKEKINIAPQGNLSSSCSDAFLKPKESAVNLHQNIFDLDEEPRGSTTLPSLELLKTYSDSDEDTESEDVEMEAEDKQKVIVQYELVDKGGWFGRMKITPDMIDEGEENMRKGVFRQKVCDEMVDEEMGHQSTGTCKQKVVCNKTTDEGTRLKSSWPFNNNHNVSDEMENEGTNKQSDGVCKPIVLVGDETMDQGIGHQQSKEKLLVHDEIFNVCLKKSQVAPATGFAAPASSSKGIGLEGASTGFNFGSGTPKQTGAASSPASSSTGFSLGRGGLAAAVATPVSSAGFGGAPVASQPPTTSFSLSLGGPSTTTITASTGNSTAITPIAYNPGSSHTQGTSINLAASAVKMPAFGKSTASELASSAPGFQGIDNNDIVYASINETTTEKEVVNGGIRHSGMDGGSLKEPSALHTLKIFISDEMSKLILGNRGENIVHMQVETGCMVQLRSEKTEKVCILSGTLESVNQARSMFEKISAQKYGDSSWSSNASGEAEAQNHRSQSIRKEPVDRKINQNMIKKYEVKKPLIKKKTVNSQYRPLVEMNATDNETNYSDGEKYSHSSIEVSEPVVKEKDVNSQQGLHFLLAATEYDSHFTIEDYEEVIEESDAMEMDDDNPQVEEEFGEMEDGNAQVRRENVGVDYADTGDRQEAVVMDNVDAEDREREDEEGAQKINKQKSKFECPQCSCKFQSAVKLENHYDSKHVPKPCVVCGRRVSKKHMDRHVAIHFQKNSDKFTCQVDGCKSVISRKDNFLQHIKKYHS